MAERFKFHSRVQKQGESVRDYLAALRKLSKHCGFKKFRMEALCDRFVCGLSKKAIQHKLLTEDNLTLNKALNTAHSMELAASQASQLQKALETCQQPGDIHELSRVTGKNPRRKQLAMNQGKPMGKACWQCGKFNHAAWNCEH